MKPPDPTMNAPARYGEVYDRGYKHYEGERLGRPQAFRALIRYSVSRALGIRKRWTAKIVPIVLYAVAAGVVLVVIGVEAFMARLGGGVLMDYADFFAFIFMIEGIFVATIAPEMLCPDRRENVLTLYFSKAITRRDYVLAKLAAAAILTLTLSFIPAAILWLLRNLLADAPLGALADNVGELARIALAGGLISLYLGALGLAISSFTGRKVIAVTVIAVGYLVTEGLVNSIAFALRENRIADWIAFASPMTISNNLVASLFPKQTSLDGLPFHWWAYAAGMAVTIIVACAVMIWRYVPED